MRPPEFVSDCPNCTMYNACKQNAGFTSFWEKKKECGKFEEKKSSSDSKYPVGIFFFCFLSFCFHFNLYQVIDSAARAQ